MQNYKVHGLSEIMIFHCDMDKDEFFQMERREYSDFIDVCFAISYGKKKYDLIGNTMTNSSQMKVYKN